MATYATVDCAQHVLREACGADAEVVVTALEIMQRDPSRSVEDCLKEALARWQTPHPLPLWVTHRNVGFLP